MTQTQKLEAIQKILDGEKVIPLKRDLEDELRGLAADWMDNPTHAMYGEILMDRLNGK